VSKERVETVRGFFAAIERGFEAYWENPRSILGALEGDDLWPEWKEVFGYTHPQIEWRMAFLGETYRGHLQAAAAWDDFLAWAEDYRPRVEELADLGGDYVFAVVGLVGRSKKSGMRVGARLFTLFTVREGLIVRVEEYTDRDQAREAVDPSLRGARF
jgi:ketosteroid isomerase-like protein